MKLALMRASHAGGQGPYHRANPTWPLSGHIRLTQSHHVTRPPRSQKCERQPVLRHTEGCKVGHCFASTRRSHRGLASRISMSSIVSPQPQGQSIPTDQSSPSSRRRTRSRLGSLRGSASPSITSNSRGGCQASHLRRAHRMSRRDTRRRFSKTRIKPRPSSAASVREGRVEVRCRRAQPRNSARQGMHPQRCSLLRRRRD